MKIVKLLIAFGLGIALGSFLALASITREVLFDYASGGVRHIVKAGPFYVYDKQIIDSAFQVYIIEKDFFGPPDWRLAQRSRLFGGASASFEAGKVLYYSSRLGFYFPTLEYTEAQNIKIEFLHIVNSDGSGALLDYYNKKHSELTNRFVHP